MKIAIQGHLTKGKEVIQVLESLGGINPYNHSGNNCDCYYEIHGNTIVCACTKSDNYKYYTLEEFEEEFPFKIGDKVIIPDYNNKKGTIVDIAPCGPILSYFIKLETGNGIYRPTKSVKPYKEMKEERNITLTLDKAQEWYKKGGELREIALQVFTENELNPLPKSWEEFAESIKFTFNGHLEYIDGIEYRSNSCFPNKSIGESSEICNKHVALFQLEQLRDCWRQGWVLNWSDHSEKWCIALCGNELSVSITTIIPRFLTFPTKEMAKEFLKCFRDLIEKAGDLI